jgi:hypothetical protein
MKNVRALSEPPPLWTLSLGTAVADVLTRGAAMGLLGAQGAGAAGLVAPSAPLDARHLHQLLQGLQQHGIGSDARHLLAPLLQANGPTQEALERMDPAAQQAVALGLRRLSEALEDSAAPAAEWPAMRAIFGDEMLGALLEVSPASLRRYAGGERATPQAVADRLHWLALVVADLAGAYNDFGMRRWFERPRSQLGGKSPRQLLGKRWSVDGEAAARVRALASALRGANPLAA